MCTNVDEMISYSHVAWTLAGNISKSVFMLDYSEDINIEDETTSLVQSIIDEGFVYA